MLRNLKEKTLKFPKYYRMVSYGDVCTHSHILMWHKKDMEGGKKKKEGAKELSKWLY